MTRPRILAANWKMHVAPDAAQAFMDVFLAAYTPVAGRTVVIFPPAVSLLTVAMCVRRRADIAAGVQNVFWERKGAFTGEISASLAHAAGASFALVGHSERRHIFGETDQDTTRKCRAVVDAGMRPMLCVGETLAEREEGRTEQIVLRQLTTALAGADGSDVTGLAIAYEPVWAIGTGRTATPDDASTVHGVIRQAMVSSFGPPAAGVPILYGGSVTPANATSLLAAPDIDGVLVGGASLEPASWLAITRA
ncbi:MAG: triose-phosphate isomerase [Gemmatimonadaceae bacterium]